MGKVYDPVHDKLDPDPKNGLVNAVTSHNVRFNIIDLNKMLDAEI